jgi:hypothetical protein
MFYPLRVLLYFIYRPSKTEQRLRVLLNKRRSSMANLKFIELESSLGVFVPLGSQS